MDGWSVQTYYMFAVYNAVLLCLYVLNDHETYMMKKWDVCLKHHYHSIEWCYKILTEYECDHPRMTREECEKYILFDSHK